MEKVFDFIRDGFEFLAQNETVFWIVVAAVIVAYFVLNAVLTPYLKYNRLLKRNLKYLKKCDEMRIHVNLNKVVFPKELAPGFENYLKSEMRFPSEMCLFKPKRLGNYGISVVAICFALSFAVVVTVKTVYSFMPFVLFCVYVVLQAFICQIRGFKDKRAKKLTVLFGRQLDRFLGQSMFAKQQLNADDLCLDTDVDETVAKINFLKANGLGENTANEVAALLSAERLNKVRTREQQKKLNLALNGLLQVMSKKQEQAQVQPQPKEA